MSPGVGPRMAAQQDLFMGMLLNLKSCPTENKQVQAKS